MKDFIPRAIRKEAITIRLEDTTVQVLGCVAEIYGMSRNEPVAQCVQYALKNLSNFAPPPKKEEEEAPQT